MCVCVRVPQEMWHSKQVGEIKQGDPGFLLQVNSYGNRYQRGPVEGAKLDEQVADLSGEELERDGKKESFEGGGRKRVQIHVVLSLLLQTTAGKRHWPCASWGIWYSFKIPVMTLVQILTRLFFTCEYFKAQKSSGCTLAG